MYVSYSQMAVLVYVSRIFLYIYVITCIYCSFIIMLCQYLIFFLQICWISVHLQKRLQLK